MMLMMMMTTTTKTTTMMMIMIMEWELEVNCIQHSLHFRNLILLDIPG